MSNLQRMTFNVPKPLSDFVKEYAERNGIATTDAAVRALQLFLFLDKQHQAGFSILIRNGEQTQELVFIF